MIFITLARFKKKPTKAMIAETSKLMEQGQKETGGKILGLYWTLGRYDVARAGGKEGFDRSAKRCDIISSLECL